MRSIVIFRFFSHLPLLFVYQCITFLPLIFRFSLYKQGKVVVTFVIEKDGSITNAKVTQALYPSLDEESLRIVKSMPKWTPGKMKDGKVVRVQYTVPLTYRLQ